MFSTYLSSTSIFIAVAAFVAVPVEGLKAAKKAPVEAIQKPPAFKCAQMTFRRNEQIGKGAYGQVLSVDNVKVRDSKGTLHNLGNKRYALKVVDVFVNKYDDTEVKQMESEIEILQHLSQHDGSANVVKLYHWTVQKKSKPCYDHLHRFMGMFPVDEYQLLMEHIDGFELSDVLRGKKKINVMTNLLERLFPQIARAFEYIHGKGVVHLDIKPQNIMVTKDGVIKIIDFGLGKMFTKHDKFMLEGDYAKRMCGSREYRAPEVGMWTTGSEPGYVCVHEDYKRTRRFNAAKVDVYALGQVFCELALASNKFSGDREIDGRSRITKLGDVMDMDKRQPKLFELARKALINFFTAKESELPPSEKQLIAGMMNVNADERFTIDQVVKHLSAAGSNATASTSVPSVPGRA